MQDNFHIKNYHPFYKFLFNISPGFLHRSLEKFSISLIGQEAYKEYRARSIRVDKIRFQLFSLAVDNAIYGNNKYTEALNNLKAGEIIGKSNSKGQNESDIGILKVFKGLSKESVINLLEKIKIDSLAEKVEVSGENLNRVKALMSVGKKRVKEVKLGRTGLSFKEFQNIMQQKSKLDPEDIVNKINSPPSKNLGKYI